MTARAATEPAPEFSGDRPPDTRRTRPWHPQAYIVRHWPRHLQRVCSTLALPPHARVLDYGCADAPYRHFFPATAEFVPADIPGNPRAEVEIAPDGTLPVEDASFDAVLSTQVLEHVRDPALYLTECFRVLRPGGQLVLSTHGIFPYHPDPVDLWRWTSAGLRLKVERAGLAVERIEGFMGQTAVGLQIIQSAVYNRLPRYVRGLFSMFMQQLMRLAEALQTPAGREHDALIFVVVARRP